MISSKFSIEAFAEAVKAMDSQEVIAMAVQEATEADRLVLKNSPHAETEALQDYSRNLKQLINYHRYAVKPRRPKKITYQLYMRYWGQADSLDQLLQQSVPPVKRSN